MSKALIEQLAKEHSKSTTRYQVFPTEYAFTINHLEAMFKAYAQTQGQSNWIPKLGDLVHPSKEVCEKYTEWKPTELLKIVGINYKTVSGQLGKYSDVVDLTVIELANEYGATDGWKLEDVVPAAPIESGVKG